MKTEDFHRGRRPVDRSLTVRTPAKVNLHLEILRLRHDGYHEIETIFQALALFDTVTVTLCEQYRGGAPRIELTCTGLPGTPADEANLCWQAARLFCLRKKVSGFFRIGLHKAIPLAAGLGGGSSDAAATLLACARLFDLEDDHQHLAALAAELGADVPFFLRGGTALGRGIGTVLLPLPPLRSCQFLIVKPPLELSTSEVYRKLKMGLTVNSPKANINVVKPLLARFPHETWLGFNRLEEVVLPAQAGARP
jgi:4-diphosphocytidyl-2-C-methyl-D-erythritol kinase